MVKFFDINGLENSLFNINVNFNLSSDKPKLVLDTNIKGSFGIGEFNGLHGILTLPLHISNTGKQATTINYVQLFILDNKKRKLTYGFKYKDIDKTINPGETFKIDLHKILFVKSDINIIKYRSVLEREIRDKPFKFMFSSVYEGHLTRELFAKVLVITPHKTWTFEIPLIEMRYSKDFFIEDLKKAEELDKNFNGCYWDKFSSSQTPLNNLLFLFCNSIQLID